MTAHAPVVGVTGVTGNVGGKVAHRLAAAQDRVAQDEVAQVEVAQVGVGPDLVLLARSPERVTHRVGQVRECHYGDAAQALEALTGVDTLLMVSGAESQDRVEQHRTFVDAAARAGVRHVVYTSFLGAAPDATFTLARDHWHTEECIRASGMGFTFLRDSLYADFAPFMVGPDGVIRGPAGDGRASVVAQDDIAEVAAAVLRDPGAHDGATYDLTGPEALTLGQVAEVLSEVLGRPVRYQPETLPEAYASRAVYGAPDWQVDAWVSTYTAMARGELATVSDAIPALTGHPARDLREVLQRQRADAAS